MQNHNAREKRLETIVRDLTDRLAVTHAYLQMIDNRLDHNGADSEMIMDVVGMISRCQILTLVDLPGWDAMRVATGLTGNAKQEPRLSDGYKLLKSAIYKGMRDGRENATPVA